MRAFEEICNKVRGEISSGRLKAGDKLPPEREMAEQFGVGRNAVREALRSLEMAGVVRLEKGRSGGAFIRPANASRVTHAIGDLLDYGSIGWPELNEARTMVLDIVVRLACERATDADFEALERNLDQTDEVTRQGRLEERTQRTTEFYTLLAAGTRNRALVLMVTSMSDLVRRFIEIASRHGRDPIASLVTERRRLVRLLRARDADRASAEMARQLLRIHRLMEPRVDSQAVPASESSRLAAIVAVGSARAKKRPSGGTAWPGGTVRQLKSVVKPRTR